MGGVGFRGFRWGRGGGVQPGGVQVGEGGVQGGCSGGGFSGGGGGCVQVGD